MLVVGIILFIIALLYFIFWTSVLVLVLKLAFWVIVACGVFLLLLALFLLIRFIFSFFQAVRGYRGRGGQNWLLWGVIWLSVAYLFKNVINWRQQFYGRKAHFIY